MVSGCPYCRYSIVYRKPKHTYQTGIMPTSPRSVYNFDILGGLGDSNFGFKWIYLAVDSYSGYTIIKAGKTKSAQEIRDFLYEILINHGIFSEIVVDGELSLEWSTDFQTFFNQL